MIRSLLLCSILTLVVGAGISQAAEQRALLGLAINGIRISDTTAVFRGDDILLPVSTLEKSRIINFVGKRFKVREVDFVSLKSLAHILLFQFQESTLTLQLTIRPESLIGGAPEVFHDSSTVFLDPGNYPAGSKVDGTHPALVAVEVNGESQGNIPIVLRGSQVLVDAAELRTIGLDQHYSDKKRNGPNLVALESISPNLTYKLDQSRLSLAITINDYSVSQLAPVQPASTNSKEKGLANDQSSRAQEQNHVEIQKSIRDSRDIPPQSHSPPQPAPPIEPPTPNKSKVPDQPAILTVRINEIKKGETDVILRGDDVLVRASDLEAAGVVGISGKEEVIRKERFVLLSSLSTYLSFKVNDQLLSLDLTVHPGALGHRILDFFGNRPPEVEYREDTSGFLNYSFQVQDINRLSTFSEAGLSIKNALLYGSVSRTATGNLVRGLSNLTFSNRESLTRVVVGDRLINSDVLGGSLTFGGVSYYREFGLDPYFVRNPGLHYAGAVATPSNLDVYVNGKFIRRVPIAPGQFDIRDLPVPSGSADTRLVLRDAFGREQEITTDNYFTSGLLKAGVHEYSYNLGLQRNLLGIENWDYGPLIFIARHRMGFTNSLSAGLRLEASSNFMMSGGPSISFLLPYGEAELAGAASVERGQVGGAAFLGYTYIGPDFNIGTSLRLSSTKYATTSLRAEDKRSWLEAGLSFGTSLIDRVALNIGYTIGLDSIEGQKHRVRVAANMPLTKRLRLFFDANYLQQFDSRSLGFITGINFLFGEVTNGTVALENRDGKISNVTTLQKSLPVGPGLGYRFQANLGGELQTIDSLVQYQSAYGRYEANYTRIGDRNLTLMSAAGGLAYVGGNVFATRPVQESFAVLRIPELGNIRGYLNNLDAGRTNSDGDLFIPSLLSYYGNKLSISPKDVPINYNVDIVNKFIAPPFRGGALIEFPAQRIQRLVGQVVIGLKGKDFVPGYGQLTLQQKDKSWESPLGKNAEFYFENITAGAYQASIGHKEHNCEFTIQIPKSKEDEIRLGTVRCEKR